MLVMAKIKITIDRLQPGLYIEIPLGWNKHPFLMNSFKLKNEKQIEIIKNLGIKYVYIDAVKSSAIPLPPKHNENSNLDQNSIDDSQSINEINKLWEEKQQSIDKSSAYRRRIQDCEREFQNSISRIKSIIEKIRISPKFSLDETQELSDILVDKLLKDENITIHLMSSCKNIDDVYLHSLNVTLISIMIARVKGFDSDTIKQIAFAAILHDIGKVKIPTSIIRKKSALTEPEFNYLKLHVKYGCEIIGSFDGISDLTKTIIAQHHERNDGSGYPNSLKEEQINEFSKIVIVANEYDRLCRFHNSSEKRLPSNVLSYLFKNCQHLYSQDNLSILVKSIGVYPPGTIVLLSDDSIGIVIAVNSDNLLYPDVLLYDPNIPRFQAPIIHLYENDLKIVEVLNVDKLPIEVRDYLNPLARASYFFDS